MNERPPFPTVWDNTMVSAGKSCMRKLYYEYLSHWKPKLPSVHLHAGGAYAHGLEAARKAFFDDGKSEEDSIAIGLQALIQFYGDFECPADSAKSLERMCGAFEYYFTQYPMSSDAAIPHLLPSGKRGVEFSFAEPIDVTHPETGDPLIYCGRMDMICDYAGGVFGEDDKTTSSLGASWAKQWDLRGQFTGYCWGTAKAGMPLSGFLIRGVSILKTKYDTQQALTYRAPWMIERWYEGVCRKIEEFKKAWETDTWPHDESEACMSYGGCPFRQVCMSQDPLPWLEGSFTKRAWNPLTRQEESV